MVVLLLVLFIGASINASQMSEAAPPKHDYTLSRSKQVLFDGVADGYQSRLKVVTTLTDNKTGQKVTQTTYFGKLQEDADAQYFEAYDGHNYYISIKDKNSSEKASLEGMFTILRRAVQRYCFYRLALVLEFLENKSIDFDKQDLLQEIQETVAVEQRCVIQ